MPSLHAATLRFDDPKDKEKNPVEGGGGPGRYQQLQKMFDNHLTTQLHGYSFIDYQQFHKMFDNDLLTTTL